MSLQFFFPSLEYFENNFKTSFDEDKDRVSILLY